MARRNEGQHGMGETPEDIRRQIEQARHRLGQDLNELEYRFSANWRARYLRHPWAFLGAAFCGAMLIALMMGRR